jgi:hypothetical protein
VEEVDRPVGGDGRTGVDVGADRFGGDGSTARGRQELGRGVGRQPCRVYANFRGFARGFVAAFRFAMASRTARATARCFEGRSPMFSGASSLQSLSMSACVCAAAMKFVQPVIFFFDLAIIATFLSLGHA